ncbi:MAG: PQQ-binding-like beta-propeller repeat protein [bacterium]
MKYLGHLAILALLVAGAGAAPAPDSLVAPAETDTLAELEIGIFPPEGVRIPYSYQIAWGDGETLDWTEPLQVSYEAYRRHRYTSLGEFEIRVRLRDSLKQVSDWGKPLTVRVTEPRLKWVFPTFDPVVAAPALDENGNVYIGDDTGWLYSLDSTGILRWGFETDDALFSGAVVQGNRVYVGSLDSNFYCLDRDKGKQAWKVRLADEAYTPPAVDEKGNAYVGTDGGLVIAVSPKGKVSWRFDTGDEIIGSPTIGPDGSIFVASDSLYCLDSRGKQRWAFGHAEDEFFLASPVLDAAGNCYIGSSEGRVYAVGPDGGLLWNVALPDGDEIMAELAVGPDGVFWFGTDAGYLYRLDPASGEIRQAYECLDAISATAAVSDRGTVYFLSDDGYLYALGADGRLVWRHELAVGGKDTFYTSSPLLGPDGTVYVGSWDGGLYAFRGDGPPARSFWPQFRRDARNTGRLNR